MSQHPTPQFNVENKINQYTDQTQKKYTYDPYTTNNANNSLNQFQNRDYYNLNRTTIPKNYRNNSRENLGQVSGYDAQGRIINKDNMQSHINNGNGFDNNSNSQFSNNFEIYGLNSQHNSINQMNQNNQLDQNNQIDQSRQQIHQPKPPLRAEQSRQYNNNNRSSLNTNNRQFQNQMTLTDQQYSPTFRDYNGINTGINITDCIQQMQQQPFQQQKNNGIYSGEQSNNNYHNSYQNTLGQKTDFRNPYMSYGNNQLEEMRKQNRQKSAGSSANYPQLQPNFGNKQIPIGMGNNESGTDLQHAYTQPTTQFDFNNQYNNLQR